MCEEYLLTKFRKALTKQLLQYGSLFIHTCTLCFVSQFQNNKVQINEIKAKDTA
jgi:hypothetical protein